MARSKTEGPVPPSAPVPSEVRPTVDAETWDEVGEPIYTEREPIVAQASEWPWSAADEASTILAQQPDIFLMERTRQMVRVEDEAGFPARLAEMTTAGLVDALGRLNVRLLEKRGAKRIPVPYTKAAGFLSTVLERRSSAHRWRALAGLACGPYMLTDGRVVAEAGYDVDTRLWLPQSATVQPIGLLPDGFTQAQAQDQVFELVRELGEFCWEDPNLDPAVWLSYLFTLASRPSYPTCPMHIFRATLPRSGKDLLFCLAEMVALGRQSRHIEADPEHPEEQMKVLGALLRTGQTPIVLGDATVLGSGGLLQLITEPSTATIRLLGQSEEIPIPPSLVLAATGNKLRFARPDLYGRVIVLSLDPDTPNPEQRPTRLEQDELIALYAAQRQRFLGIVFNILRGCAQARRENPSQIPTGIRCGSFPGWARIVRDAVMWAGLPDVVETQNRARDQIQTMTSDASAFLIQVLYDIWGCETWLTTTALLKAGLPGEPSARTLGIDPYRASQLDLVAVHGQLLEALDLALGDKKSSRRLVAFLAANLSSHYVMERGEQRRVRMQKGSHNHQFQVVLKLIG